MGYRRYEGLRKSAGIGDFFAAAGQLLPGAAAATLGVTKDLTLLLASIGITGGVAAGAIHAKLNKRKLSDLDNAKRMYENERLESDIGYLETKMDQEWEAKNRGAMKAKDARLLR